MNPFMWIVWGAVALLFLIVVLIALAVVLVLVTPCAAVVVALYEDVRGRWRVRLMRRRVRRVLPVLHREAVVHGATFWVVDRDRSLASPLPPAWWPVRSAPRPAPADEMAVVAATTDHGRAL